MAAFKCQARPRPVESGWSFVHPNPHPRAGRKRPAFCLLRCRCSGGQRYRLRRRLSVMTEVIAKEEGLRQHISRPSPADPDALAQRGFATDGQNQTVAGAQEAERPSNIGFPIHEPRPTQSSTSHGDRPSERKCRSAWQPSPPGFWRCSVRRRITRTRTADLREGHPHRTGSGASAGHA